MHKNMPKIINVFFDDHISEYFMLKANSKHLSKVNIIMTTKYIKYRFVNWKVCKYLERLSEDLETSMSHCKVLLSIKKLVNISGSGSNLLALL